MKLKIVNEDGIGRNTKIMNAETGEPLQNVKEFTIHGDVNGLVNVEIKLIALKFEVIAEKKKRTRKPKYPSSTVYSENCIKSYKKTVMEGEGLVDLEYVENHGISSDDKLSWYLWLYFRDTFLLEKQTKMIVSNIQDYVKSHFSIEQTGLDFKFDRTTINHCINKFHFIGLLTRNKKADECVYSFATAVKRRGLDWFRKDNKYLKGHFQTENGFFNLLEMDE
jgi:hypothetical protein